MKNWSRWLPVFFSLSLYAQEKSVQGILVNTYRESLSNINVSIAGSDVSTVSNEDGAFLLKLPADFDKGALLIWGTAVASQEIPIALKGTTNLDLGTWLLETVISEQEALPVFDLQALPFDSDGLDREQIGGFLHSGRDVFLNTAAFQFGATFFRLRGLDTGQQEVRFNGISMNGFDSGRPLWSKWGGLNDFTNRAQQSFFGIRSGFHGLGRLLGTTTLEVRPSAFRSGSRASMAFSNATYGYRTMVSHVKQPGADGWGYGFLSSRRWGNSGYVSGTPYAAFSGALLLEKIWSPAHKSWFTALYTPTQRGKNAPLTEEAFALKGRKYNPYWGFQNGNIRNARVAELKMPLLFFNHRWEPKEGTYWQWNSSYQWGHRASSRLLYNGHWIAGQTLLGGGQNPDPVYYQRLPSYFLRNTNAPDYSGAYLAEQALLQNGQIAWSSLYDANVVQAEGNALYAVYEDVQELQQLSFTLQGGHAFSSKTKVRWEGRYSQEQSDFFASPTDLLGANRVWDVNGYAESLEAAQNNLQNPNLERSVGAHFLYDYEMTTALMGFSGQAEHTAKGWTSFLGIGYETVAYRRTGRFQNGSFSENSFGQGSLQSYSAWSAKAGTRYAITGRHRIFAGLAYAGQPPAYQQVYINPRENHERVPQSRSTQSMALEAGYHWQAPSFEIQAKAYWIERKHLQEVSFYFADGVGGDEAFFVQEALTGMEQKHLGLEVAGTCAPVPEVKIRGVASVGQFVYANNPHVFLATADNPSGLRDLGFSYLEGYALAGGPQQAFSLSFEYEDPNYWRMAVYGNYFAKAYLDINPLTRSRNFYTDFDGLPFADYDPEVAKTLLTQESFEPYFLLNATAGKSWRLGKQYLGFFVSIQNLLDATYKTGGFEQGRNANYRSLLEDRQRPFPLFGSKYWRGRGTTYFSTIYLRF